MSFSSALITETRLDAANFSGFPQAKEHIPSLKASWKHWEGFPCLMKCRKAEMYVVLDPGVIALAANCSGSSVHSSMGIENYLRTAICSWTMYRVGPSP